jgi:hypothetical protein
LSRGKQPIRFNVFLRTFSDKIGLVIWEIGMVYQQHAEELSCSYSRQRVAGALVDGSIDATVVNIPYRVVDPTGALLLSLGQKTEKRVERRMNGVATIAVAPFSL